MCTFVEGAYSFDLAIVSAVHGGQCGHALIADVPTSGQATVHNAMDFSVVAQRSLRYLWHGNIDYNPEAHIATAWTSLNHV